MRQYFAFIIFLFASVQLSAQIKKTESFTFIAFGDMPYFLPEDFARFENLIKTVNNDNHAFSVHVGDIKSSKTKCTEEYYTKIYNYFQQFDKPLIYTPGDNEWTDCNKEEAGGYNPEERLDVIRKTFFKDNKSFGKEKLIVTQQSENPTYSTYVENTRWNINTVAFATLHLVGTNNNFVPNENHTHEFYNRDAANIAWLKEVFAEAKQHNNAGIILFTQADMFNEEKESSGFEHILKELKSLTIEFGKQVLLVHGDSHKFIIDKPLLHDSKSKKVITNFTRLQVFGEQDIHAVKITIQPGSAGLFYAEPFIIPGN